MSDPLVSVCIPAGDQARFLGEAIESVLAQDVDGLELLVHDDASADETPHVVERYRHDDRVRFLRHPRTLGVAENRNSCLRAARGRYVAWLDADDAYLPGALGRQLALLDAFPRAALAHGAPAIVDAAGRPQPPFRRPFARDTVEPSRSAFAELILANELTTSTVVVRRDAHEAAGPFVAVGASSSDWDMWLRLALRGDVAYGAAPVARYRQHAASISHAAAASGARLRCDARVVRRVLRAEAAQIHDLPRIARRARAALAAKALLHAGDSQARGERAVALRAVSLAARQRPRTLGDRLGRLVAATVRGDAYACHTTTKALLGRLARALDGSRYGAVVARAAASDPAWDAALARIAGTVRQVTPADAIVGTVTKWDPTLLRLSGRDGRNFPDRGSLPEGYPADSEAALAHLEQLRAEGLSHLVFPSASFWWLEHYAGLAARLGAPGPPAHADDDCVIFDLRAL
jgi:glycosyltransferase involved in cell wall biosynthesis